MAETTNVIGHHVERIDARAKATGDAVFTVDVTLPHMVHMRFLRSPHAHARVVRIDASAALEMEGVAGVVTMQELAGKKLHNDVLDERVRYLGEAVAGVAAATEELAQQALEKITVEYEVLPAVLNLADARRPDATPVWWNGNVCTSGLPISKAVRLGNGPSKPEDGPTICWEKGSVEDGFAQADAVAENTMFSQAQFHCCLEPHACVASWDRGSGVMHMWLSTQSLYDDQENLAHLLELPLERVHIVSTYIGGGFGGKVHNTCKEYALSALLSRKLRKPVKYIPNRAEESITALRHPAEFYYKVGAKADGSITAIELVANRSGGAHTSLQTSFLLGSTDFVAASYVNSPNVKYEGWSFYTNLPLCSAYRGFGYFESGAAFLQTLDMLAEKLRIDPVEFLLKNVPERGDLVGATQGPTTTDGLKKTIQQCAQTIGWAEKWHQPGQKRLPDGRLHGISLAFAMGRAYLAPTVTTGNAIIEVEADGKAHLIVGITDIGQGQTTGLAQIAAEVLGIPFEDVYVTWGDSRAPHSNFLSASATTVVTGNAVRVAAEDARRQLLECAAPLMKLRPEYLTIKDGMVQHRSVPAQKIPLARIVMLPEVKTIVGVGKWFIREEEGTPRSLVVCAAEVAVDDETGKVELINMVQGTDCGKIISRSRIEGQMQGVLSGGLGYLLMEDWAMDERLDGRILNSNLLDYKLPTFLDTMDMLQPDIILEDNDPVGPFGARGMGEATLSASAPAILNAVYNATGVRMHTTPLTPGVVLEALKKQKGDLSK